MPIMGRKTIPVDEIVEKANFALANPENSNEFKSGVIAMLEFVLFETKNYSGYNYLPSEWDGEKLRDTYNPLNRFYYLGIR